MAGGFRHCVQRHQSLYRGVHVDVLPVSRDRAKSSSFTGTSLTTTLYVGDLTWGFGRGTKLLVVTGARILSFAGFSENWLGVDMALRRGLLSACRLRSHPRQDEQGNGGSQDIGWQHVTLCGNAHHGTRRQADV